MDKLTQTRVRISWGSFKRRSKKKLWNSYFNAVNKDAHQHFLELKCKKKFFANVLGSTLSPSSLKFLL